MSQKTYEIFQAVENQAIHLAGSWENFKTSMIRHLPESYHSEIDELSNNLKTALEKFLDELRHPTLILATTGTTSSGKSTLVNFICGADIIPTAVSEMSAGVVTIEYSEEKTLIIEETPGALWECGKWNNIKEEQIYTLLEKAMISYLDNKEAQPNLAYPKFTIHYPFRLFKEYERDLPRGVRVKILDFPGLSYVGDDSNMEVIKQCREALCLVTYNSQETDPQKVKNLLLQVVEEVKCLGGSPERMLFILNKIDVFRADKNWPESERRFIEKITRNIKAELTEQLKEYTKAIENLQIIKLSTLPALLSLQIQSSDKNKSNLACTEADRKCNLLIEETILDELPRKAENWSQQDRVRVAEDLLQKSYGKEFQQDLNKHITEHFPKLVIPQAIEKFNVAAGNSIAQWAVQTTTAILNSSEENHQEEYEKIENINSSLNEFIEISNRNFRAPFEEIDRGLQEYLDLDRQTEGDLVNIFDNNIIKIIKLLQSIEIYSKILENSKILEKLAPLVDWKQSLNRGVGAILEAVAKSLDEAKISLDHPYFKKANSQQVKLLKSDLERLIQLGYSGTTAKEGEIRVAKTEDEKEKLEKLKEGLNDLSKHLNPIIVQVLSDLSEQQKNRIYESVSELFKYHLTYLEQGSNNIAPNIVIKFPTSDIEKVIKKLNFNLNLKSQLNIQSNRYAEKHRTWRHWFWILPKKQDQLFSDDANIPSTEKMLEDWDKQLKKVEPDILKQVIEWLSEQINDLQKNVDKTQNDIINLYLDRLKKARRETEFDLEKQRDIWKPIQQNAKNLATEFSKLGKFQEEEDLSAKPIN
ncbi:dynamin family protein [Spirulina sp. 06S082]|uniref:dynamin family protein n=1 Tax=Spirulina sp. 06S082 TaxID=3110248 RepID=UPI002B21F8B1|nr:dynamin family protein [Spirulina sp. 06S082]MEA5471252.1 dynamin family protein [Spirulina sp. 06S082]